jgi:hypothetical protein
MAMATAAAASTRSTRSTRCGTESRQTKEESKTSFSDQAGLLRSSGLVVPSGVKGRVIRHLDKLFDGGNSPPFDGGSGGDGGDGNNGEKFQFLEAEKYCDMLDDFANGAAARTSERLAKHSAEEYIECVEKEYERTIKMQEDRQRVALEKKCGFWEGGTVPDVAFIAMRQEDDNKKVSALWSVEQMVDHDWRNWHIRFLTGDPRGIAPRHKESEDPWTNRYKLFAWLRDYQMPLFVEQRYHERDFWYFRKSNGFDI